MEHVHDLKQDVDVKKEQASAGVDHYIDSLKAQSELLQEQQKYEHIKENAGQRIDELHEQRKQMRDQTDKIANETLNKFSETKEQARKTMDQAKCEVGGKCEPSLMDKISETFTGKPTHETEEQRQYYLRNKNHQDQI